MEYRVIRSQRKTLTIQVTEDGEILVKAPLRLTKREIEEYLWQKREWIRQRKREVREQAALYPPKQWKDGDVFYYLGKPYRLILREDRSLDEIRFCQEKETLVIESPDLSEETVRCTVLYWYRQEAKEVLPQRVRYYNQMLHLPVKSVTVKEQKKRWGSCSSLGNLNLNWKLIMAPVAILDYVVVHELCHFYEMNHSPAFWGKVEEILPDYKARRKWLREQEGMFRLD